MIKKIFIVFACTLSLYGHAFYFYDHADTYSFEGKPTLILWPSDDIYANDQVILKLIVNAGSLQESDDQLGYAHFVEHMAFNGTESYPTSTLQKKLESLGLVIGNHSNAHTYYDYTEFTIELKTDDRQQLESAIEILSQWYQSIEFNADEVDQEKKVITAEFMYRDSGKNSIYQKLNDTYYQNSEQIKRYPIGTLESVRQATPAGLKKFYQTWYNPLNTSVIVTGDFNDDFVKAKFNQYFKANKSATFIAPTRSDTTDQTTTKIVLSEFDRFSTESVLTYAFVADIKPVKTKTDVIELQKVQAAFDILVQRIEADARNDALISSIDWEWHQPNANQQMIRLNLYLSNNDFEQATRIVKSHLHNLSEGGIQKSELSHWQANRISEEAQYGDDVHSIANALELQVVTDWPAISQIEYIDILKGYLMRLTVQNINEEITQLMESHQKLYIISNNDDGRRPTDDELNTWLADAPQAASEKSFAAADYTELNLDVKTTAEAKIESQIKHLNSIYEWQFANGFRVLFKQDNSDIAYSLISSNGLNAVDPSDVPAARIMLDVAGESGLRNLTKTQLNSWLVNNGLSFEFSSYYSFFVVNGLSKSKDFSTWLNVLHLFLTDERLDESAFHKVRVSSLNQLDKIHTSPYIEWLRLVDSTLYNNEIETRTLTQQEVEAIRFEDIERVYQQHLMGNQNYTLAIVGDLHPRTVEHFAKKYIATIPSQSRKKSKPRETYGPATEGDYIGYGSGAITSDVTLRFKLPKAEFAGQPKEWSPLLEYWLESELFRTIREDQGLVYSIAASIPTTDKFEPFIYLIINTQVDPENIGQVKESIRMLLSRLASTPPKNSDKNAWMKSIHKLSVHNRRDFQLVSKRIAAANTLELPLDDVLKPLPEHTTVSPEDLTHYLTLFLSDKALKTSFTFNP
ncbi:M16 family metallopeptidase [Reinekea marinisedimentorum]|nr:M16 family metallopeptidase [Reinekea marinisedimentorum]